MTSVTKVCTLASIVSRHHAKARGTGQGVPSGSGPVARAGTPSKQQNRFGSIYLTFCLVCGR